MDPPPPQSLNPETRVTESPPLSRWYPKMSPYRVLVITTTIVLGTSKAIFAYRGISNISTTLEWIAGVVVTLLFFVLDEWESKESYPKLFRRFFTFDCAELIWRALRIFSVSRPRYRSDEPHRMLVTPPLAPLIPLTGYRILVSATVIVLGSMKAAYAYLGYNTSANSLDWTLAVFITSLMYYIGLYESNPVGLAPSFFIRDYYTICYRISRDILAIFALGISLCICVAGTSFFLSEFKNSFHELVADLSSNWDLLNASAGIFQLCRWALLGTMSVACAMCTLRATVLAAQEESALFTFLFRRGKFAKFYEDTTDRLRTTLLIALGVALYILRTITLFILIITFISVLLLCLCAMLLVTKNFVWNGVLNTEFLGAIAFLLALAAGVARMVWFLYHLISRALNPRWHNLSIYNDDDDDDD